MRKYEIIGITDEVDACEQCGTAIKRAVHLAHLDPEGNHEGEGYYGSNCASDLLGHGWNSRKVTAHAQAAQQKADEKAEWRRLRARNDLDAYAALLGAAPGDDLAACWARLERSARWELTFRFWNRNQHLREQNVEASRRGEPIVKASEQLLADVAAAWALVPDHTPTATAHAPVGHRLSGDRPTYHWACVCTRTGGLSGTWYRPEELPDAARAAHDEQLERDPLGAR